MALMTLQMIGQNGLLPPKTMWTKEEDELLTSIVQSMGARKWKSIAEHIPGRTGKQCRERWMSHISPDLKNPDWTEAEDRELERLHAMYGNKWAKLTAFFPGRPPNAIKNRWNCLLRKTNREAKENAMNKHFDSPKLVQQGKLFPIPKQSNEIEVEFQDTQFDFSSSPEFDFGFDSAFSWDI